MTFQNTCMEDGGRARKETPLFFSRRHIAYFERRGASGLGQAEITDALCEL